MKPYEQALRDWFYPRAGVPSLYHPHAAINVPETDRLQKHLAACGIVWVSEPDLGCVSVFVSTFDENDEVKGVVAQVACKCGKYKPGTGAVELFIPGEISLGQVIYGVIEAGEETGS